MREHHHNLRHYTLYAATIITITTLVRFWFVASGQLDLVQDEAQYWDWTRRPQLSYYSKGPLIAWLIGMWTGVFGDTELGVRFGALAGSALAQVMLFLGVGRLFGRPRLALLTLGVANTTPLFMVAGVLMTTDGPLLLCWLGALLCIHAATRTPRATAPYLLLAMCMAVGVLAKYMMLAVAAIACLHMWLLHRQRLLPQGVALRVVCACLAGAACGMLPILLWNAQNDWVGFKHVGTLAGVTGKASKAFLRLDRLPEHLGAQLGVATPWWLLLMLGMAWRSLRIAWTGVVPPGEPAEAAGREEAVRQSSLLFCAFMPLWGVITLWSLHTRIYPNWPAMSYVGGIILAAAGVERLLDGLGAPRWRRLVPLWFTLGACLFAAAHFQNTLPLPASLNPAARLKGWEDLGRELDRVRHGLPHPDRVFFFSDAYDITAELAFYVPGKPFTFCADFGRRMSQYDLWPSPADKVGWDAVFVRRDGTSVPRELLEMFDSAELYRYQSTHHGAPGRVFTVIVLRGFNGEWPRRSFRSF